MKKKKLLIAIVLLLVVLILKIVLLLTAKPKITVDYVAEYNRISRPANYDPNDNAAQYYQKAFDYFIRMPKELKTPLINWPEDFNNIEQAKLKGWLASNSQAFGYLKIAANKPYYWLERHANKDNNMIGMMFPESEQFRYLILAFLWNAKLEASEGRLQTAFENIIDCYKVGCQKCRTPSYTGEQLDGMGFKRAVLDSALVILDRKRPNGLALKSIQSALQAEFDNDTYIPDYTTEKLFLYDTLQRTFAGNGLGTERLAWQVPYPFNIGCEHMKEGNRWNCLIGPTRKQTARQIEKVSAISNQIMAKTPWQIKNEGRDYFEEITDLKISSFFFRFLLLDPDTVFYSYHETKAQTKALIAICAILRFKEGNHRFPASLDELVSADYLESVPMDPYSNGPLVYKLTEDNFKLYSIGEDFVDDGGSGEDKKRPITVLNGKYIVPREYPPDIVYWPVRRLDNLREKFEKREAAREAEARKGIQKADQTKY